MRISFIVLLFCTILSQVSGQSGSVTAMIIDEAQNIYLGSSVGLSKMDAANRQMTRILNGTPVSALAWSKRHGIYVACNGNEIRTPDGALFLKFEEPDIQINCLMVSGGQLWAGTNQGIYTISINRKEIADHYTPDNSILSSAHINTMFVDGSGIKWIGTDRGVLRAEGEKRWKLYEEDTRFTAITGNSEGAWLAGDKEMWLVDQYNRWYPTDVKEGLSVGPIRSLATDKKGRVYLLSDIFVQFDPYADTILPINDQSASSVAQNVALAIDDNDQLWVASAQESLKVIDPETAIVEAPVLGTLIVIHPSCAGIHDGSIQVKVQGGQPPYRFLWSHSDSFTGDHATGLPGGRYEISIVDFTGNLYTDIAELQEPVVLQALIKEDREAEGFALEADVTGGRGDLIYRWNDGTTTRKIAIQSAGTYSVTVTDINGCSTATAYALNESALATPVVDEEPIPLTEEPIEAVTVENLKVLEAEELNVGQILRIEQLQFQADSSHIQPASYAVLDGIFQFLSANERIVVEIGGHTNGLPDHEYCDRLSSARAKSVAEYIISKGIPAQRIIYHGYGKRKPVATNQTVEGRRKNQRVEVKILQM